MLPAREVSYAKVDHPEMLPTSDGNVLQLIDDPVVDRISKGDSILGWEGDARLAMYLNQRDRRWELWRLEADNVYRKTTSVPTDVKTGIDAVGWMIQKLVECDSRRRTTSLADELFAEEAKRRAQVDRELSEFSRESAERIAFGLEKDGVV